MECSGRMQRANAAIAPAKTEQSKVHAGQPTVHMQYSMHLLTLLGHQLLPTRPTAHPQVLYSPCCRRPGSCASLRSGLASEAPEEDLCASGQNLCDVNGHLLHLAIVNEVGGCVVLCCIVLGAVALLCVSAAPLVPVGWQPRQAMLPCLCRLSPCTAPPPYRPAAVHGLPLPLCPVRPGAPEDAGPHIERPHGKHGC